VSMPERTKIRRAFWFSLTEWSKAMSFDPFDEGFWSWREAQRPELLKEYEALEEVAELTPIGTDEADLLCIDAFVVLLECFKKSVLLYLKEGQGRRFSPPFLSKFQGSYSYALECLEGTVEKAEAFAGSLSYGTFWSWFEEKKGQVFKKLLALEVELEKAYKAASDPDERIRFDELVKSWLETIKWAVAEFKGNS